MDTKADKYRRNIDLSQDEQWDDTFQMLSWWKSKKVKNAKIMVVGAGAIGNEVLKNLALMNIGQIVIVDYDTIEYANLARSVLFREEDCKKNEFKVDAASKRIKQINPSVKVMVLKGKIPSDVGLGICRRMDVIISCLDNRLARLELNRMSYKINKIWIDAAVENLFGRSSTYIPYKSCYECRLTENDKQIIFQQVGCSDIAKRNLTYGRIPTTPISSSIVAAIEVQEALKVVHGYYDKLLPKSTFMYDGMTNEVGYYKEDKALIEDCISHQTYSDIIPAMDLGCNSTLNDLFTWLKLHLNEESPIIELNYLLILEIFPQHLKKPIQLIIADHKLNANKYRKKEDEDIYITRTIQTIDKEFERKDLTLKEIGIPALDILTVIGKNRQYYIELTKDEEFITFN